jgi:hypothetical protein
MTDSATKGTVSEFQPFMERSCGRWVSRRRYLFGKNLTSGEYVTEFDISPTEDLSYKITWVGKTEGEMDVTVRGNRLERSRSYFNSDDDSGYQEMYWIDADTVVFYTAYDGTKFREEIRFLDNDTRLRQTVGRDQETNDVTLVGQYYEVRVA